MRVKYTKYNYTFNWLKNKCMCMIWSNLPFITQPAIAQWSPRGGSQSRPPKMFIYIVLEVMVN